MKSIFEIESKFVNDTLKGGNNLKEEINLFKSKYELTKSKINKLQIEHDQSNSEEDKSIIIKKISNLNIKAVEIQTQISI